MRTVSMPATIVSRPGQTEIAVSAPMTGIVTRIYAMRGEAVLPGSPMFDLRLTHEDLVEKQSSLLRSLEELDVEKREVARLEDVTASGAVAGKRLLEGQYAQQKIEASVRAERQALLLHGLSEEQIEQIVEKRQLLQKLTILAPPLSDGDAAEQHVEYLQVADIPVNMGEHVATGTQLATVTDHCELLIEGKAFEQDAKSLSEAANSQADVTALISTQRCRDAGDRQTPYPVRRQQGRARFASSEFLCSPAQRIGAQRRIFDGASFHRLALPTGPES